MDMYFLLLISPEERDVLSDMLLAYRYDKQEKYRDVTRPRGVERAVAERILRLAAQFDKRLQTAPYTRGDVISC